MPGPMPDPSSPQFVTWLRSYDQPTQQLILRELGMNAASGNPFSTSGGLAPQLTDFAYDVPSMLGGIPISTNSKGVPNPQNVEQAAKRTNYAQDLIGSGGLGSDMITMMTGGQGSDPSAWTPVRKGTGTPLSFENRAMAEQLAESGGGDFQSFMAAEMLKGATPAAAFTKLKQVIKGVDGVSQASPELLDSLNAYVNADFDPTGAGRELDITNDRDFSTLYDVKGIQGWASDLYKGLAKDRALEQSGYRDEKTGQVYSGFVDEDTPQMKAAKELGLALPTQSYADDDYVKDFQRRTLGSDDTYDAMDRQARVDESKFALDRAQAEATQGQDYMTAVRRAYEANHPSAPRTMGSGGPATAVGSDYMMGNPALLRRLSDTEFGGPSANALGMGAAVGGPIDPVSTHYSGATITGTTDRPLTGLGATFPEEQMGAVGLPGYVIPDTGPNGTDSKKKPKGAVTSVKDLGAGFALGSLAGPGRKEVEAATARKTKGNQKASEAQQAYYRSQFMNDDEMGRASLAATMRLLAHQGRTPMQDQLAARSQTLRNLIGY